MKAYLTLSLLVSASISLATIPVPKWELEKRAPTNITEIASYIIEVLPQLSPEIAKEIQAAQKADKIDAEINAIIYKARLQEMINETTKSIFQESGEFVSALESQWDHLVNAKDQSGANKGNTLENMLLLNELNERIKDKKDQLLNLDKYTKLFSLKGAPLTIYWKAERHYKGLDCDRAVNLFKFLINESNPNGFTKGNSHYWLGKDFRERKIDIIDSFNHYMKVHKYPSCLVYTAHAYLEAGILLADNYNYEKAAALMAINVPCIGSKNIEIERHINMAGYGLLLKDETNVVKHLHRVLALDPKNKAPKLIIKKVPKGEVLWESLITNQWCEFDEVDYIWRAMENENPTPNDRALFEALNHKWPSIEEIPLIILTNRVLSNNIFENKKRFIKN